MVPGRYVRTPAGTPHYPGFHNLGSRDWTSDERDPWPELGEWEGARSYFSGAAPEPFPRAILLGDASCLRNGEPLPLPLILPPFIDGFPARCFTTRTGLPPPRPARLDIFQADTQLALAEIQALLYTDPTQAAALLTAFLGPGSTVAVVGDSSSLVPGSLVGRSPTQTVVVISGTSNAQQLAVQWLYGAIGIVNYGSFATMPLWYTSATAINVRMNSAGVDLTVPLTIVGHSYGGAVGTVLTGRIMETHPTADVQLLTFGMPRPGDSRLQTFIKRARQLHIVNTGDPIAFAPPTGVELFPLSLVVPAPLLQRWQQTATIPQQMLLFPDGSFRFTSSLGIPWSVVTDLVAAAIAGTALPLYVNHLMAEYVQRLRGKQPIPPPEDFMTGAIVFWPNALPPAGWLTCDGSAVSRVLYPLLFGVIGTTFGPGDGSTTFNLPDVRGRALIGSGTGPGLSPRALAAQVGEENHVLTTPELSSHVHTLTDPGHSHTVAVTAAGAGATYATSSAHVLPGTINTSTELIGITQTDSEGADGGHNTMQPSIVAMAIIKT